MTPTGLQQTAETPANTAETDLVVPLDAKTAELMGIWERLDDDQREQVLEWMRTKTKHATG